MNCYIVQFFLVSLASFLISSTAISPALILTPLIKQNRTTEARNLSLVNPSLFLNLTSHSGFLTVDEKYNSNSFFWYFPVIGKPVKEAPWIIWLQGGPGASSLAGLFDEIGPLEYTYEGLKLRKWSWTANHSMLFIDNPIGAGFSFTNSEEGFAKNMEMYSSHLYTAVQQFLTIFPELRTAPLFVAGESYAGRYVPALCTKIMENSKSREPINLQGLIMGNPVLNRESVANFTAAFYNWGLIDTQGALALKPLQDNYSNAIRNGDNSLAFKYRNDLLDKLEDMTLLHQFYNVLADGYSFDGFQGYIQRADVREALHVGEIKFTFDNSSVHSHLVQDFLSEIVPKVEALLDHYRVLIYCGQLDLTAPCVPNAMSRRNWQWKRRGDFLKAPRQPLWYNESVAGYVKNGGGLTEVLVRGAGHLVPLEKPAPTQELVSYFIRDLDMPLPPNYQPNPADTPDLPSYPDSQKARTVSSNAGLIVSVVINVILVLLVIAGIIQYIRVKRRNEELFYSSVDNVSDDIFLS